MRLFRPGLALILMLFIIQNGWSDTPAPTAVTVIQPEQRDMVRWIRLPGAAEADAEVTLYAKASGFLKDFHADLGDRLKPGQAIGRLDAPEYEQDVKLAEAQLTSAQADVASAQAALASAQLHGEELDAKRATLQAELQKARAEADRTQKEYERVKKLAGRNAATEREREYQEYSYQMLDAAVLVAQSHLAALKPERDLWRKDVEAKAAAVEAARSKAAVAKASLERARILNEYTTLTIPVVGTHPESTLIVTKRFVSNGELITGGPGPRTGLQPIVSLAVLDPVRIVADVPEQESAFVDAGVPVTVALFSNAKDTAPTAAKVSRSSQALMSDARTMRIEVDLPNPQGRIKPGMMANLEIALETHKGVLAVPASSVLNDKTGPKVFTNAGGKAKAIPVTAGFTDHGMIEVSAEGLSPQTPLIKDVQAGISEGTPLAVK